LAVLGYLPYRCKNCRKRFMHFRFAPAAKSVSRHPSLEREIKATRNALKAERKLREFLLYGLALMLFFAFLYYVTRDHDSGADNRSAATAPGSCRHSTDT
jgi:hypothetical protein